WLAAAPGGEAWLRERLVLGEEALHRLLTCRAPLPDRFTVDVMALAGYVGVEPTALAAGLREAAVLAALSVDRAATPSQDPHAGPGLLAAARDNAAEQLPRAAGVARVRELASDTWSAAPEGARRRRDIDAAVVWASPVAVVSVSRLSLASVNRWLAEHGAP